jgi:hypothetical protein
LALGTPTSWSLLGLGVEAGLAPNIMRVLVFFPFQLFGSFLFLFLTSKLDVQCMVKAKKEQTQFCFKTLINRCSINILNNALHLMGEQHFNSYFYKKSKSYKACNRSKNRVCFNIVVGFEN